MKKSHDYKGMGSQYDLARAGTPKFASFMISNTNLPSNDHLLIVEFGIGGGKQTIHVESELRNRTITNYTLVGYDRSFDPSPQGDDQLNTLIGKIEAGELSRKVIALPYDIDGNRLPHATGSIDLSYMAFVHHHLSYQQETLNEIGRITKVGGHHFIFGATLEDLSNHPLNEFFTVKYEVDARRYPTREALESMFDKAGFNYQGYESVLRDDEKPIDEAFLESVENKSLNSALKIIAEEDPEGFAKGLKIIKQEVDKGKSSGTPRLFSIFRTIHWGVKR